MHRRCLHSVAQLDLGGLYMYLKLNNNVTDSALVPNTTSYSPIAPDGAASYVNGLYDGVASNALNYNFTSIFSNFGATNVGSNFNFGDGTTDQDFSLGIIIQPTSNGSRRTLLAKGDYRDTVYPKAYILELQADNTLRFRVDDNSAGAYKQVVTTSTYTSGNIYDVDAVYSSGTLYIYVNGVLATTTPTTSGSYTAMESSVGSLQIGKQVSFGDYIYAGYMDEITVWSRALTSGDISIKHNKYLLGQTLL